MKYIKTFENKNINQQPFYLHGDRLYLSDNMVDIVYPTKEYIQHIIDHNYNYINNVKSKSKSYKETFLITGLKLRYDNNHYRMDLLLKRGKKKNEYGQFNHYLDGISGDYKMHTKGMIRATRECNLKFIVLYYPIAEHIKNYKKLKNKEPFLSIIEDGIISNPDIAKNGVPNELYDKYGYLEIANNYNL